MAPREDPSCEYNGDEISPGLLQIARTFDIPPRELMECLDYAASILAQMNEHVRPANKKALLGVAKKITKLQENLLEAEVRQRLLLALGDKEAGSATDELDEYEKRSDAVARLDRSISNLTDLIDIIKVGERYKSNNGKPDDERLEMIAIILTSFWKDEQHRNVTISGHPNDRNVGKPSKFVQFTHDCMRYLEVKYLGRNISVQHCRSLLIDLRKKYGRRDLKGVWDAFVSKELSQSPQIPLPSVSKRERK